MDDTGKKTRPGSGAVRDLAAAIAGSRGHGPGHDTAYPHPALRAKEANAEARSPRSLSFASHRGSVFAGLRGGRGLPPYPGGTVAGMCEALRITLRPVGVYNNPA